MKRVLLLLLALVLLTSSFASCTGTTPGGDDTSEAGETTEGTPEYPAYYVKDGYAVETLYPMAESMLDYAGDYFSDIYETYLKDTAKNIYFSVIPDKNYFLAEAAGIPHIDYDLFAKTISEKLPFTTYIDIYDTLEIGDYYRTDLHWRQEALPETAKALVAAMGVTLNETYTEVTLDTPFAGEYTEDVEQSLSADALVYLTNAMLEGCTVTEYGTGAAKEGVMYDIEKAESKAPYDFYLHGPCPLVVIDNPNATTDKHLVIFRDSFTSSLAPLLCEGYAKITLVDLRYMRSSAVGSFVDFTDAEVLFLYSANILNTSMIMH